MSKIYVILQVENHPDRLAEIVDTGYTSQEAADTAVERLVERDATRQAKRGYPNATLYHYHVWPVQVVDSTYTDPFAV